MNRHRLPALALLAAAGLLAACGPKRPPLVSTAMPSESTPEESARRTPAEPIDVGPDVQPVDRDSAYGTDVATSDLPPDEVSPLQDVRFDFDSAALTDEARGVLEKHALWLQTNRDARVAVEGHCDERGTVEYNLALGEQRARAALDYLVSLGVAPERLTAVSYGKERPFDPGHDESAWARNRRAHFGVSR